MNQPIRLLPILLVFVLTTRADDGWKADPTLQGDLAKKKIKWIYREEDVPPYIIPDPLLMQDGSHVTTREQWEQKGRPEALELFRKYVYGRSPEHFHFESAVTATDEKALDGKATHKTLKITVSDAPGSKSFSFPAHLFIPNGLNKPTPAFILINNRPVSSADPTRKDKVEFWPVEDVIARGYATGVFQTNDVDPDKNGPEARAKGIRAVLTSPGKENEDAWATIGAWAFAASRVLDYLETDKAIDAKHVAVIGHSRGGKTALWAGAQDQRFALSCSNCSGCTGAALNRRIFGETVAVINKGFPYWFCGNFHQFDNHEDKLPVDQHQLLALIAPRAVAIASADADFWADQKGEFLSLAAASPVFALYGFGPIHDTEMPPLDTPFERTPRHYHVRRGIHNLTAYDWKCYLDFADKLWK